MKMESLISEERMEEVKSVIVTCLLASQIMNETLDDLKETSFYKAKLKESTKQFIIQITNTCNKHIDEIWGYDDLAARQAQEAIMNIAKRLAKMKSSEILELSIQLENECTIREC